MYFSSEQQILGMAATVLYLNVALENNNQVSIISIFAQMDLMGTWDAIVFMLL